MVAKDNEDIVAAARAGPAPRHQRKPLTEKRVPRVGDLDYIPLSRVLERGINERSRLTIFRTIFY
jgi:hypothetical protein